MPGEPNPMGPQGLFDLRVGRRSSTVRAAGSDAPSPPALPRAVHGSRSTALSRIEEGGWPTASRPPAGAPPRSPRNCHRDACRRLRDRGDGAAGSHRHPGAQRVDRDPPRLHRRGGRRLRRAGRGQPQIVASVAAERRPRNGGKVLGTGRRRRQHPGSQAESAPRGLRRPEERADQHDRQSGAPVCARGVTLNNLAPGAIGTERNAAVLDDPAYRVAWRSKSRPNGSAFRRTASAPACSYARGGSLHHRQHAVDGGWHAA